MFVSVKDRITGNIIATVANKRTAKVLRGVINDNLNERAQVYTDEAPAYKELKNHKHEAVNHSVSEYGRGEAHTVGIRTIWVLLKRGYHDTFHHESPNHLHGRVNEFATHFSFARFGYN